jgi:hypothetical protein
MTAPRRLARGRAPFALVAALTIGGYATAAAADYRIHRPIEPAPGWNRLELPNDVLDATRPGLPDLRIRTEKGGEIPFAIDDAEPTRAVRIALVDVESLPGKDTRATLDRGPRPGLADGMEIEVTESEFIKPVTIESSPDQATWVEIAHASIFATREGGATRKVRFPKNDRRYWRLRLDDRNGPPVHPLAVVVSRSGEPRTRDRVTLGAKAETDADLSFSTFAVALPSANLPAVELGLDVADPAFARRVRVFERISFRDESSRRLLGEGNIVRSADGRERTSIAISEPTGRSLEVDVERMSSGPPRVTGAWVDVERRGLLFHAPKDEHLELVYGSRTVKTPSYDIRAALAAGRPAAFATATLGAAVDSGPTAAVVAPTSRGGALDLAQWKTRQPIVLPARATVAYLDLDDGGRSLSDVRIVDASSQQVPYLVESTPRHVRGAVTWRIERAPRRTLVRIDGLATETNLAALEVDVASPDYFSRPFRVVETLVDRRGPTGERELGSGTFIKTEDGPRVPMHVALARPSGPSVTIEIDDGDNAPLDVTGVASDLTRRRINFVVQPNDRLTLASDNPSASPPHYDLTLIADKILSSPAEGASLGPAVPPGEAARTTPRWFWLFVLASALVLFFALARALSREPERPV